METHRDNILLNTTSILVAIVCDHIYQFNLQRAACAFSEAGDIARGHFESLEDAVLTSASSPAATLRDQVYDDLRRALMTGRFMPGQKITIRSLAAALGTSLTPIRETLRRLIAEGALEGQPNRSVRVPLMTRGRILELRDIRLALEGLAAARAAERIATSEIAGLRLLSLEIVAARDRGDTLTDMARVGEFQFAVYRSADMPNLMRVIETLWVQTGPYMNLLFPDYMKKKRGEWRARLCRALEARDADQARHEIETDIDEALTYIAGLADANGVIHPDAKSAPRRPSARRQLQGALSDRDPF